MSRGENWAGGLSICALLIGAGEVTYQLERTADSQLVLGVAAICTWLVALWSVMKVAWWMDRNQQRDRVAELERELRQSEALAERDRLERERLELELERRAAREALEERANRMTGHVHTFGKTPDA